MTREKLRLEMQEIACTVSGRTLDHWDDAQVLAGLGIDSAELLEMVAELEDRLHIEIPLHTLERLTTVGDLLTDIVARVVAR